MLGYKVTLRLRMSSHDAHYAGELVDGARMLALFGDLATELHVTQPTVSHHLAILREAGLVDLRHEGKQTFYTLNQKRIAICCGQLMINFAPEAEATEHVLKVLS